MFSSCHIFRKAVLILGLTTAFSAVAKIAVPELLDTLPAGTSASFIAKNLETNQIIVEHRSEAFMLPASTQKVFTALATKLTLPEDFRFQTAFLTNGKVENGVLKGDLIAKFSGDPRLTNTQLTELISTLKQQGINQITGDLILDVSVFASHNKASGWVWNDLSQCFNAPPAAVNIDRNCFYANVDANQPIGSILKVDVPAEYPVQVMSSAYVAENAEVPYCQFDVVMSDRNQYQLKGCIAQQAKKFGLSFAVQDPTAYGANIIKAKLKRLGIMFNGQTQIASKSQSGNVLAVHYSDDLAILIKKMLKKSDNQIADTLFRTVANQVHNRSATFPLASQTLRNVLKSKANIDLGNSVVADGSGLSRHNQVSAKTMLQAVEFIAQNDTQLKLLDGFPIAGVDGTLAGRGSMIPAPLANNIIAKTGGFKRGL